MGTRKMQKLAMVLLATVSAPGVFARCAYRPSSSPSIPTPSSSLLPTSSSLLASSASSSSPVPSSSSVSPSSIGSSSSALPSSISSSAAPSSASSSAPPALPTYPCDGTAYLVRGNTLSEIDIGSGAVETIISDLGFDIDALAYHPLDKYLYGFQQGDNRVVRIDRNGVITQHSGPDAQPATMGTIDTDGYYWLGHGPDGFWAKIDVRPNWRPGDYTDFGWNQAFANLGYRILDWVDLSLGNDEYLYTVATGGPGDGTSTLLRFSKITKQWEVLNELYNTPSSGWGAMYGFEGSGPNFNTLFATDNASGQIWKFQLSNGAAEFFSQSTATQDGVGTDGTACRSGPPPAGTTLG